MLTIFTIPKPFQGQIEVIQRNAIQSWLQLRPACEIILCGDDPGVAETAAEFGVAHIPDIARNEYGTPLLGSAFAQAQEIAKHETVCYANADIIFLSDLTTTVRRITGPRFLIVGRRWDLDITAPIDFQETDWEQQFRETVANHATLSKPIGSDYFIFPKGIIGKLPEFAVGRPYWDNWLIYHARALDLPVIDATRAVTAVHQNHDYAHVPDRTGKMWIGPEGDRNLTLMGWERRFKMLDATHIIGENGLERALEDDYLKYRMNRLLVLTDSTNSAVRLLQRARARALLALYYRRHHLPDRLWRHFIYHASR